MLGIVFAALAAAASPSASHPASPSIAVDAPISSVTVFNDRARVVREAQIELRGDRTSNRYELALLPDSVEPDSIRLEIKGAEAEVRRVELDHIDVDEFPEGEARKLLDQLDEADDRIAAVAREKKALAAQLASVTGLAPVAPFPSKTEQREQAAPKLNPSGWAQVLAFLESSSERLQARLRDAIVRIDRLQRERQKLAREAEAIGAVRRRTGLRVIAVLSGSGTARATLSYVVEQAEWRPSWELVYHPEDETVRARLDGLVEQETGEEWSAAKLVLSTAVPGIHSELPELLSWRIGSKERFVPISHALSPPARIAMLPTPPANRQASDAEDLKRAEVSRERLRATLLEKAERTDAAEQVETNKSANAKSFDALLSAVPGAPNDAYGVAFNGSGSPESTVVKNEAAKRAPAKAAAAPVPTAAQPPLFRNAPKLGAKPAPPPPPAEAQSYSTSAEMVMETKTSRARPVIDVRPAGSVQQIGLAPPPVWSPPSFGPDSPSALAGGFDLAFPAAQPATLESGSAEHRVPLLEENFSVHTERVMYPALAQQAWLVAKLTVPQGSALPGGEAMLYVGKDPAGSARLQPMAPGEEITLPLGIDRDLKPVRNVVQVQSEVGLFTKDDDDQYTVTIEVANPYARAIPVRIIDQLPLQGNQRVEVELLSAQPAVTPDHDTGKLEWALTLPAGQKTLFTFSYRLRRLHGERLHQ